MKAALKLDSVDLRILEAVQENARITKLALAEKVGLSATPCWLRLRKLEEAGVVTGYHARIAYRKIAPIAHVIVQITLGNHRQSDFERFERAIAAVPEIVSCWSVGGGVDYFLMIVARDIDGYQRLIDRLLDQNIGIERYFTYIVTKLVKDEKTSAPLSLLKEIAG
ncbi:MULTISPECIES: Lrp/AsnC family transcriptional regulator [Brucella/Ochrobactrum group]|uniref:Lrp/AsnC family transcriptional regulator n=1 Tax=Brucella/Ochrobactrum group TaxID=2826938 RepID=UPI00111D1A51|nr:MULTISPECIES: Lrp/AsnC family transcriptional regulator [Brucella/Ochrobactrum group]